MAKETSKAYDAIVIVGGLLFSALQRSCQVLTLWPFSAVVRQFQRTVSPDLRDNRKLVHAPKRYSFLEVLRLHI